MDDTPRYTSVEEQVEYGLDTIPEDRMVSVPLRDLMYVFQTVGEFIRFFHQPLHFQSLADLIEFLGDGDSGGFHLLSECYYHRMREMIPPDIDSSFDAGIFDSPHPPHYYKPDQG